MQKTISNGLIAVLATALLYAMLIVSAPHARAEGGAHDNKSETQTVDYKYQTPSKANLTVLVRKSLLLYDQQNESISLTKAGVVYAETNIVNQIGPRQLAVNEEVIIPRDLVEEFAKKAAELTPAKQTAWQAYTTGVDFELVQISTADGTSSANTSQTNVDENASPEAGGSDEAKNASDKPADQKAKNGSTTTWIIAVAATLAIAYYIVGGGSSPKKPAQKTVKKNAKKTVKKTARKNKK